MPSNREHGALEVTNLSPVKTRKITVAIAWDNLPTRLEIPALSTTTTTTPKIKLTDSDSDDAIATAATPKIKLREPDNDNAAASGSKNHLRLSVIDDLNLPLLRQTPSGSINSPVAATRINVDKYIEEEPVAQLRPVINLPRTSSPYPLNITQGTLIRNAKKFWNAKGETAWYESASSEARTSLPLISTLPELRDGDIFLHKISPIAGDSPTTHQLWLRSNGSWLPIEPGHNLTDINGRDRTLVMTSDSEPSWVLRSTARRNYNPKKKTRALNKEQPRGG